MSIICWLIDNHNNNNDIDWFLYLPVYYITVLYISLIALT